MQYLMLTKVRPVYLNNLKYGAEQREKKQYLLKVQNMMYCHETPNFRMEQINTDIGDQFFSFPEIIRYRTYS